MVREVLEAFQPQSGQNFIDATLGDGGHAEALLERTAPNGKLLGIERDQEMLQRAKKRLASFASRIVCIHGNYEDIFPLAKRHGFLESHGAFFDLGVASRHFGDTKRGFSFKHNEPLDMRFDTRDTHTAYDIVNHFSKEELADVLLRFGEEHESQRVAQAILNYRPVTTTYMLATIVTRAKRHRPRGTHAATKTFQALRIAVNRELEILECALPQAVHAIRAGGFLGVIAYHSLEDRIVKSFMRGQATQGKLRVLSAKPVRPSLHEVRVNPKARSAKFRAAQKL